MALKTLQFSGERLGRALTTSFPGIPEGRGLGAFVMQFWQHDALNTKGNFCFDREMVGWRHNKTLDMRRKRTYARDT